jgi:hypothetical protein
MIFMCGINPKLNEAEIIAEFSAHEVLHTAHLLASSWDDWIYRHPFVENNEQLKKEAQEISDRLGKFYQFVGQIRFANADSPLPTDEEKDIGETNQD